MFVEHPTFSSQHSQELCLAIIWGLAAFAGVLLELTQGHSTRLRLEVLIGPHSSGTFAHEHEGSAI